ncbi:MULTISPECIES: phage shock protein PspD [Serratia]|uniref:Peripheral inner membrane phage-shock protein n=1 Tax=Serratia plymuthica TaxID=82996 RepID=A0A2X4UZL2_SERPL|nr:MULTISPECIES: phage shock protein PspD [Serratia]AEF45739.1 phage shock protein PspD [Serratia plymuthica AS9]AEF50690.1 phage shock protein PspD [Serratia sp. AS12]AEG28397.1 phage shock protein PspD [Serratia sp. AS13]NIC28185.1 phage shock protein PspD [Serratia plymuthica]QPS20652.1 phage shock protein PspD [Serratia plymuthica]
MNKTYAANAVKSAGIKQGAGTVLKTLSKVIIMALLNYGPAGAAGWLLRTVGRKPIRFVLALVLEPLFRKGLNKVFGRYVAGAKMPPR